MSETSTEALRLLNQTAMAEMLGVTTRTISNWTRAKILPEPLVQQGKSVYWSRKQVERWQEANTGTIRKEK